MDATKPFSTRETAAILDASEAQVRALARLGPMDADPAREGPLEFSFQDLLLLKTTKGLLDAGVPRPRVRRIWASLRRQLGADLPLTSVTIFADGDHVIACDGEARWRPDSGQFLLELDAQEVAREAAEATASVGRVTPRATPEPQAPEPAPPGHADRRHRRQRPGGDERLREDSETWSAEQWFHHGCEIEVDEPLAARHAYERALELDPALADAHVNLGRHYHEQGELGKAEAHYRDAIRLAPDDATSRFNLGVLLEDRGRADEALHAYEQAIARDPELADAHYNLGLLLESRGRAEALRHLMAARRLYARTGEDAR